MNHIMYIYTVYIYKASVRDSDDDRHISDLWKHLAKRIKTCQTLFGHVRTVQVKRCKEDLSIPGGPRPFPLDVDTALLC